jgi:hypothetical protein
MEPRKPRWSGRLAWFIGLYIASAAIFAVVVYGLRAMIPR